MKYLIRTTELYRIDEENEAKNFINEQKQSNAYNVVKYSCELKEKKVKGEVADTWYRVTLVKDFNDEKDPYEEVEIHYGEN